MTKTTNTNRPIAPEIVRAPEVDTKLNYEISTKRHITPKLEWTEVRWTTYIETKSGKQVLDTHVPLPVVMKRARALGREAVYVTH